jgi:hypothetical protein
MEAVSSVNAGGKTFKHGTLHRTVSHLVDARYAAFEYERSTNAFDFKLLIQMKKITSQCVYKNKMKFAATSVRSFF